MVPKNSILKLITSSAEADAILVRLSKNLHPIPFAGCLIWDAAHDGNYYGKFKYKNLLLFVHRTIWELTRGPIPQGWVLDHCVCHYKGCCEPNHLEAVTYRENTWRGPGRETQFKKPGDYHEIAKLPAPETFEQIPEDMLIT